MVVTTAKTGAKAEERNTEMERAHKALKADLEKEREGAKEMTSAMVSLLKLELSTTAAPRSAIKENETTEAPTESDRRNSRIIICPRRSLLYLVISNNRSE